MRLSQMSVSLKAPWTLRCAPPNPLKHVHSFWETLFQTFWFGNWVYIVLACGAQRRTSKFSKSHLVWHIAFARNFRYTIPTNTPSGEWFHSGVWRFFLLQVKGRHIFFASRWQYAWTKTHKLSSWVERSACQVSIFQHHQEACFGKAESTRKEFRKVQKAGTFCVVELGARNTSEKKEKLGCFLSCLFFCHFSSTIQLSSCSLVFMKINYFSTLLLEFSEDSLSEEYNFKDERKMTGKCFLQGYYLGKLIGMLGRS